jgi:hypothetical protein
MAKDNKEQRLYNMQEIKNKCFMTKRLRDILFMAQFISIIIVFLLINLIFN